MSYRHVHSVLESPEPKGSFRLVKIVLAEHANESGTCWPAMPTIARRAAISVRQCKRIIHELAETGHIEIEYGVGLKHPNKYRVITQSNGVMGDTIQDEEMVTSRAQMVSPEASNGVMGDTKKGDIAVSPKPSENHKRKVREKEPELELDAAVSMFEDEFSDKPVRASLSRMRDKHHRSLTPSACREWLKREKEGKRPSRKSKCSWDIPASKINATYDPKGLAASQYEDIHPSSIPKDPAMWRDFLADRHADRQGMALKDITPEMATEYEEYKTTANAEATRLHQEIRQKILAIPAGQVSSHRSELSDKLMDEVRKGTTVARQERATSIKGASYDDAFTGPIRPGTEDFAVNKRLSLYGMNPDGTPRTKQQFDDLNSPFRKALPSHESGHGDGMRKGTPVPDPEIRTGAAGGQGQDKNQSNNDMSAIIGWLTSIDGKLPILITN